MSIRLGIDVGGTFTDVVVAHGNTIARGKADTTPHDLTLGLLRAIDGVATQLAMTRNQLLLRLDSVVYSTTVGTNALVEHKGPRLGLITTAGFEDTILVGRARNWADGLPPEARFDRARARRPQPLVAREMTVGVRERIDQAGHVLMPLDEDDALAKIRLLVDAGARGFVVVLLSSSVNAAHERRLRALIRELYPEPYLGYMPVFLSSDVSPQVGEYVRSMTTILDAFLRMSTEEHLLRLTDEFRDVGYSKPFLVAKCTGGASSLSRTRPIHMLGSGPVAGIIGSQRTAVECGLTNVAVCDMGGTSFDVGLLLEGQRQNYEFDPVIDRWRVQVPIVAHWSIGSGGGSVAKVDSGRLRVGPESAGAMPGPACYARGGSDPTVTDADVVLGYIAPDHFLGGKLVLDRERAIRAVETRIARPLGVSVEEAAWAIKTMVDGFMGQEIYEIIGLHSGLDPREFCVFALGGAGPVHAAGYSAFADVSRWLVPPFGSVGGAYGTLALDLLQTYEKGIRCVLFSSSSKAYDSSALAPINATIQELLVSAQRDMDEEGIDRASVDLQLDFLMRFGQQRHVLPIRGPLSVRGVSDLQTLCDVFVKTYALAFGSGSVYIEAGVELVMLRLNAIGALEHPKSAPQPAPTDGSSKGQRDAYWGPGPGRVPTPVYERQGLTTDRIFDGPALLESNDTVCVVPPGWQFRSDERRVLWVERQR